MTEEYIHNLDKHNFFFSSVASLAFAQFGTNELFSRGFFLQKKKNHPNIFEFQKHIKEFGFGQDVEREIFNTRTFTPLIFIPGFKTKDNSKVYIMNPTYSAIQLVEDLDVRADINIELTHLTIITAWEKIRPFKLANTPALQFFRHVRNAAAHNGKFHFDSGVLNTANGELRKEAKWNSFKIKSSLQGTALIAKNKSDVISFWDQGDLVEFLLDFETHYPEIKITNP